MTECSLCNEQMIDKVSMTCTAQHSFCFKCILKNIEVNSTLKTCPNCRGGDKFIVFPNISPNNLGGSNDFYSLVYFTKSLPIIQKILNYQGNSCLISENILLFYIKNKKQIDIAHKLIPDYKIDDLILLIKWDKQPDLLNLASDAFGFFRNANTNTTNTPIPPIHFSQRENRERNRDNNRDRDRDNNRNGFINEHLFDEFVLPFVFGNRQ